MEINHMLIDELKSVKPSPSMQAKLQAEKMMAEGLTVYNFTIGEPDLPTPRHIIDGAIKALNEVQATYVSPMGITSLRQAIVDKLARENHVTYGLDDIIVGNGAKHIIYACFAVTLKPQDEVIIPAPYWVSYPDMVALNRGTPVCIVCDEQHEFKLTPAQLEAAITPKTKWLVLNSPSNPTGSVYSSEELQALAEVLRKYPQVMVMSDEIYEHFIYSGKPHVSLLNVAPDLKARIFLVNGLSKSFSFTGWRIGYGAGAVWLIKAINILFSQSTTCVNVIAQYAAVTAINGPQACVHETVATFAKRKAVIVKLINDIPGITCLDPAGAFYIYPNVTALLGKQTPDNNVLATDADIVAYLLREAHVAVMNGTPYGTPGYLRLSFASSLADIEAGLAAMKQAILKLR